MIRAARNLKEEGPAGADLSVAQQLAGLSQPSLGPLSAPFEEVVDAASHDEEDEQGLDRELGAAVADVAPVQDRVAALDERVGDEARSGGQVLVLAEPGFLDPVPSAIGPRGLPVFGWSRSLPSSSAR